MFLMLIIEMKKIETNIVVVLHDDFQSYIQSYIAIYLHTSWDINHYRTANNFNMIDSRFIIIFMYKSLSVRVFLIFSLKDEKS